MTFRAAVRHCLVVLIIGVASFAGLVGIDFGHHWDEPERIGTLIHARERGELLPNWYNYPSVVHDLLMATALPELVSGGPPEAAVEQRAGDREGVSAFLASHAFLLRARCVFFCVSMISVLATYLTVWRWRRDLFQAAFGAALIGFSWELGYHARWIAPDAIAASCASVCLCFLGEARSSPRRRLWLSLAAAVAGIGCGAKYPSGLLLLPCILAAFREKEVGARAKVVDIAILIPAFMAAYLLTTPGTLLQYAKFATDVGIEIRHYATGHGSGHSISPGLQHLARELEYLGLVAFSPFPAAAAAAALLVLVGAGALFRSDRWQLAVLAAFPVAYVSFMSSQHVMMARNLLVVFPFLAMLAAAGAGRVAELASASRWAKGAWMVAAGLALSANGFFLVSAGWSCRPKALPSPEGTLRNRLLESGTPGIAASPRVVAALSMLDPGAAAPVVGSDADAPLFALYSTDVRDQSRWTANEPFFLMEVFGPREVNLNYYPGWLGRSHIVVVRRSDGERLLAPRGAR